MNRTVVLSLVWGTLATISVASAAPRQAATIDRRYTGSDHDAYLLQADRVRLLVRQAQLEVSARLGLIQYREGFQYPMTIRFEDHVPAGLESALAYVRLGQDDQGFAQELVVNVTASKNAGMDFDRIFYHEMTHAVLNDAVGGNAALRIPRWVQEGLAQWVSGEGPGRVAEAGQTVRRSQASVLLADLDGPAYGRSYPQYYLAIQYIYDRHSVNSVEALVRNLIAGQSLTQALEDATGLGTQRFLDNVRDYSLDKFRDKALPDY